MNALFGTCWLSTVCLWFFTWKKAGTNTVSQFTLSIEEDKLSHHDDAEVTFSVMLVSAQFGCHTWNWELLVTLEQLRCTTAWAGALHSKLRNNRACRLHPSVCLSDCLSVHPSVCPSVFPSIHLSVCTFIPLSVSQFVHLSAHPSIYLSVFPSICLSNHSSNHPSVIICPPSVHSTLQSFTRAR